MKSTRHLKLLIDSLLQEVVECIPWVEVEGN